MKEKLDKLFDAVRSYKKSLSIITDIILILLSLYLAYLIRLGSIDKIDERYLYQISLIALIIVPFKIIIFWIFRLYHISFRYVSLGEVLSIFKASALSSPMIAFIALVFRDWVIFSGFPRSVIFIDFFLTFFFITSIRAFFRIYYSPSNKKKGREILIVGSGHAGEQIVRDMMTSPLSSYLPIGLIDDDPQKKNTLIHGIRVLGGKGGYTKTCKRS